jgi:hypothetical protein
MITVFLLTMIVSYVPIPTPNALEPVLHDAGVHGSPEVIGRWVDLQECEKVKAMLSRGLLTNQHLYCVPATKMKDKP